MPRHHFPPPAHASRVAVAAVLASGLLLSACSGSSGGSAVSSDSAHASSTATSAPTSSTSSSTTAPTSPSDPGSSTSGTTAGRCAESQLKALIDPRPVGGTSNSAGDKAVIVDFRNTSSRACTITGYPGAALVNSSGTQVRQATRTIRGRLLGLPPGRNTLPTVTLQPGAYASAGIEGVNQQEQGAAQAGCDNASYPRILVTPPNTRTAVPFDVTWPVCYSFTVHPTNIEKNPPN